MRRYDRLVLLGGLTALTLAGCGTSGNRTRGGQNTLRSPMMRGMPLTSSGAIWVPTSERHGRLAAAADW